MSGLIETLLTKRYGPPEVQKLDDLIEYRWNCHDDQRCSVLYAGIEPIGSKRYASEFEWLYGNYVGGLLIGDSLKLATLQSQCIYGLYTMQELQQLPAIQDALREDRGIHFFMDAANVWYYGHKSGNLYVYDAETEELDDIGPIEEGLISLFIDWEDAAFEEGH